jgi:hypothetical protein
VIVGVVTAPLVEDADGVGVPPVDGISEGVGDADDVGVAVTVTALLLGELE